MSGPTKFGLLLYPGFEVLDVFGPLEALNVISRPAFDSMHPHVPGVTLAIIAEQVGNVSPGDEQTDGKKEGSSFTENIVAQYSLDDALTLGLEVLIIPGGTGSYAAISRGTVSRWLAKIFPSLRYLITVCTGSHIAADAGVLDGLRATSNKQGWSSLHAPWAGKTYWVAHARWVVGSPKVWTTSGVSAGTDGFIAWIKEVYGEVYGVKACEWMEYIPNTNPSTDPFSTKLQDIPPTQH
eukprot:TRINITY_DN3666_c0_g1_i1.p1 TRINITY_DN3666_c0_g1~~TRINITY_DN3666_c0_g1_i1.p1  ORF type:complete len:238 (+),score=32.77 TRINITY_DN3666_c0_g1_i1:154-867(+)